MWNCVMRALFLKKLLPTCLKNNKERVNSKGKLKDYLYFAEWPSKSNSWDKGEGYRLFYFMFIIFMFGLNVRINWPFIPETRDMTFYIECCIIPSCAVCDGSKKTILPLHIYEVTNAMDILSNSQIKSIIFLFGLTPISSLFIFLDTVNVLILINARYLPWYFIHDLTLE